MPRLKEVDSPQELANNVLLSSLVRCCKNLSETSASSFIEVQEAVAAMKERILTHIPTSLIAKFLASFINECASFVHDQLSGRVVLEMIMDMEVVGLQLTRQSLRFLKPDDAPRLRKLTELDLCHTRGVDDEGSEAIDLAKFHLNNLKTLKYPKHCTDSDLEIIGRNCPNLEVLDLRDSESITDEGLRFLNSCPDLRVVRVDRCPKVTHISLSFLSSGHRKLEDFSFGTDAIFQVSGISRYGYVRQMEQPVFDMLSGLDFTVQCPSLTRFTYENYLQDSTTVELKTVLQKFPNLTCLRVKCIRVEDLSVLKHLNKLTELSVIFDGGPIMSIRKETWLSFQEALTTIGTNLTSLKIDDHNSLSQDDMNFIFVSCPNLEYLEIEQIAIHEDSLVVPPFRKLKELIFRPRKYYDTWCVPIRKPVLKFEEMLSLEILSVYYMKMDFVFLESMMLDNVTFPNLKVVKLNSVKPEDIAKIEQTARENNLDFRTQNDQANQYYEDRCSFSSYYSEEEDYGDFVDYSSVDEEDD